MNQETKQELEQLLHEAMDSIVIEAPEGYEPIPIDIYKKYLRSLRESYRPDLNSLTTSYYRPNIQNEVVKLKFLDFIKVPFKDYINQERNVIQPASYGIGNGGSASGQSVEVLLTKLLQIAIASGVQRAIAAFDKSITETKGLFQQIVLLQGPSTPPESSDELTEIQICEGIRFVFLPDNPEKLPPYLFDGGFSSLFFQSHPSIFSLKAIIVIDCEVVPLFIAPKFGVPTINSDGSKSIGPIKDAYPFQIAKKSTEYPEFDVDLFCQAISLTCNFDCVPILDWGHIDPDEIFSMRGFGRIPLARCILPSDPIGLGEISKTQTPKIKQFYEILVNLDSGTREKLQITINRWIKSKAGNNPVDKMIDLGIAFESLYLSGTESKNEIRFRFSLHAAWHLGEGKEHREGLMKKFKAIYDWRSAVVHTGKLPKKGSGKKKKSYTQEEVREFIRDAQDLCRDSIVKILEDGKFPDWNNLILG